VLVPGGALWLTVPFVGPLHEQPYDFYRYTEFALEELLSAAGFVDIELKRLGGYFTALGALVHGFGAATGVRGSGDYARRGLAAVARGVGRRLPALDRMDRAGVLPLGYGVRARRASTSRE
jgi:hypothetical protein